MSANFYDLLKYAATGIASHEMTYFDKMRALSMAGSGKIKTLTGIPPLSFKANGKPLISLSMLGNTQQTGTPSPDNIIMPDFCGKLVGADWTIPITCAGQTVPVYLGQVNTVRRVKKLVLTGDETWSKDKSNDNPLLGDYFYTNIISEMLPYSSLISSHFITGDKNIINSVWVSLSDRPRIGVTISKNYTGIIDTDSKQERISKFKTYLATQSAETPVTVWYVLATPETAIVNEPLAKIGDYADELHSSDAAVTIPTTKGDNTLTVDTDLQPSSMTITGHIE